MAGCAGDCHAGGGAATEAQCDGVGAAVCCDRGTHCPCNRHRHVVGISIGKSGRTARRSDRNIHSACSVGRRGGRNCRGVVDGVAQGSCTSEADCSGARQIGTGERDRGAAGGTADVGGDGRQRGHSGTGDQQVIRGNTTVVVAVIQSDAEGIRAGCGGGAMQDRGRRAWRSVQYEPWREARRHSVIVWVVCVTLYPPVQRHCAPYGRYGDAHGLSYGDGR